ncbi:MAG TPA: nuclear transport factor 2 family protein [Acidimicrobiia bacterium]
MTNTLKDWIEGYRMAWETRDAAAVGALFTPDGTYRSNIFEPAHQGRDGVGAYWTDVTSVQSEVSVRMGEPFVDGSRVTVEFWTNMKVAGDPVTLPGCLLLDFNDDWLCTSLREYWHFQPGTFAPPLGWGT